MYQRPFCAETFAGIGIHTCDRLQVSLTAYPLLLLCILGTGIAPLCAPSNGWAYYHTDHLHALSGYRPESAWVSYGPARILSYSKH